MRYVVTLGLLVAGASFVFVALVSLLFFFAVILELNSEDLDRILGSLLLARAGEHSVEVSSSSCVPLDLPGEGSRVFEVMASGTATGSVGDALRFYGPPAQAEHSCGGWADCVRPEDGPALIRWEVAGIGVREEDLLPDYVANLTVRIENGTEVLGEMQVAIPCGTTYRLQVSTISTVTNESVGGGTVSTDPPILSCDSYCEATVLAGDWITLYATPNQDSVFSFWSDACSGTPTNEPCRLRMDGDRWAQAMFAPMDAIPGGFGNGNDSTSDGVTGGETGGGDVSFVAECAYVGSYGIDLSEYEVTLWGSADAPAGGYLKIQTDPASTFTPEVACGSWDRTNDCTSTGSSTDWAYRYGFYSRGNPGILQPSASVTDSSYYILSSATGQLACP